MKPTLFRHGIFLAILSVSSAVSLARAQVIFDNLGSSNPFTPAAGYIIGGPTGEVALKFTAGSSGFLDYADLWLWNYLGNPMVNVALLANSASNTPGAILETSSVVAPTYPGATPVSHVEFSNSTLITVGTVYWLAVSPGDTTSHTAWEYFTLPLGTMTFDSGELGFADAWAAPSTDTQTGARIFATTGAVPEPSTYGMVGAAILGAIIVGRRRIAR